MSMWKYNYLGVELRHLVYKNMRLIGDISPTRLLRNVERFLQGEMECSTLPVNKWSRNEEKKKSYI